MLWPCVEGRAVAVGIGSRDYRRTAVSRKPFSAAKTAIFGRWLTVTSLNGVIVDR